MKGKIKAKYDLTEKFLSRRDSPCAVKDVSAHVHFNGTNSRLMYELKQDARFIAVRDGFVGLRHKKYDLKAWNKENKGRFSTVAELAAEFLAKQSTPCHVDKVRKYVVKFQKCKPQSILGACHLNKQFIVIKPKYIGLRSKKYDLVKWKKDNLATLGTLSDCIEEFLSKYDSPRHVDEVAEYIQRYRPFKTRNLILNLDRKRFVVYKPKFIGLKSKKYDLDKWKREHKDVMGTMPDLVAEFLEKNDWPCHKNNIAAYVSQFRKCDPDILVKYCSNDKRFKNIKYNFVILRGKKYNLEEWRVKNKEIAGTHADFVADFLASKDKPCHKTEIAKYISQYRNCSVDAMMKLCLNDKRFVSPRQGYLGLAKRKYNLYEWRQSLPKPLSMPDLAAQYLEKHNLPRHKDQVAAYVSKYKTCDANRLRHFCGKDQRFMLLPGDYIALWAKSDKIEEWKRQNIFRIGTNSDLAEMYLAKHDFPCHASEVATYIEKYRPCDVKALVAGCRADKRFFVIKPGYIGLHSKKYGLGKWGQEHLGTINNTSGIIEVFLAKHREPCHISEIAKYVKLYRTSSERTLLKRCSEDPRFIVIRPGYVILKTRNYDLENWKKRNITTVGNMWDIVVEFLEGKNTPCHVDEILTSVRKYRNFGRRYLIDRLTDDKRVIKVAPSCYGLRSKTYDLKKWKRDAVTLFGSAKDIAINFMAQQNSPVHINQVVSYVRKFRRITLTGFKGSLRMDQRLVIFNKGYIALWGKDYAQDEFKDLKVIQAATVGDIVRQLLFQRKTSLSVNEIIDYLKPCREINAKWLLAQLEMDTRFRKLRNGNIELNKKMRK
jgi:hypothetical protein